MEPDLMFDLPKNRSASIKVIGVGGGGSNAVNYMFQQGIKGVDFVICNTDAQALNNSPIPTKIQLGISITEGLGAGANPEIGEQAALESLEDLKAILDSNTKMVFITAGMGGGTGTGAAPILAGVAKEMGILTVGICTIPFSFEGKMRLEQAELGLEKFRDSVDSLIVINNNKLRELYGNLGYKAGFSKADEVLATAAKGIAEVITHHYATNIDLRDAKTVLANSGTAIMGSARASGENKAKDAIESALDSPLLNNNKITGAQNVLLLIVSDQNEITIDEIGIINDYIQNEAGNHANIIMGIGEDDNLGEEISITVVATGFPMDDQKYTGKEEQKIFHRLEEDQPLTQELTTGVSKPSNTMGNPKIQKFELEDTSESEEEMSFNFSISEPEENHNEIEIKTIESQINRESMVEETLTKSEASQQKSLFQEEKTIIFQLEDDEIHKVESEIDNSLLETTEEELPEPTIINKATELELTSDSKERLEESLEACNPFDSTISDSLSKQIEERKNRLKQFNFKFQKIVNKDQVEEVEKIPAYERQGLELDEHKSEVPSDFVVGENDRNETKIRPNNYLHKNVD